MFYSINSISLANLLLAVFQLFYAKGEVFNIETPNKFNIKTQ